MREIYSGICVLEVPKKFKKMKPKAYKIMGMKEYYKKTGHFYGKIIVDRKFRILDGYVIYCTAKLLRVSNVPIVMVNRWDRFVHFIKNHCRKVVEWYVKIST